MLLLDKDIKSLLLVRRDSDENFALPYIQNGEESCITNIGYDLRAECFMRDGKSLSTCQLEPGESVFVGSKEVIGFDNYLVGRVVLKNSRIRMGLTIDAPVYQPGHITPIYFRLTNISQDEIILGHLEKYATLMFEQLDSAPDNPYNGTFQKEFSFQGLAGYKSKYFDQIQSIGDKMHDIKSLEKSIYGNVITILTIFVAIFTILNVNISLVQTVSGIQVLSYNVIILGAISFLVVLMDEVLHRESNHKHYLWSIPIVCFMISVAIFFLG